MGLELFQGIPSGERHILFGEYPGDNPFSVTSRHLIPYGDLPFGLHSPHSLTPGAFISILPGENLDINNYSAFPMGNLREVS